jgi:hypothetical protein
MKPPTGSGMLLGGLYVANRIAVVAEAQGAGS